MKRTVYHPPASALPPGFKFPKAYLDYVSQDEVPDMEPWYLMCLLTDTIYTGYYDGWLDIVKKQYPDRQLVPFAKWDLDDDIACFELSEDPELPSIHFIHSFTKPGYEERGSCATFEEWLEVALGEAAAYHADFPAAEDDEYPLIP